MAKRRPSLVAEIGRLFLEYPEADWRALADRLRDRAFIEEIASVIDELAMRRPAERVKKARAALPGRRESVIAAIAREDEEKAAKLAELKSRLTDRDERLPLAYIRGLASSLGMKERLANRRDQAVNQIVRYLASMATAEIDRTLKSAMPPNRADGHEFDRWVKLILGTSAHEENESGGKEE